MTKPSLFPINNHPCHCNPTPSEPFGEWMKVRDQVSKLKGEFNKEIDIVTTQLAEKVNLTDSMYLKIKEASVLPSDFEPILPFKLTFDAQLNASY